MILMGVVNLTPDSFFAESRAGSVDAAAARIRELLDRDCSIIDLGAVSTRPGAPDVSADEEWRRLAPVLHWAAAEKFLRNPATLGEVRGGTVQGGNRPERWGRAKRDVPEGLFPPLSIDTTRAEIVRRAYGVVGRFIVNDISAGEDDPEMLSTVAELGLPYVAMHKRGNPRTMDALCDYPRGVVAELDAYFGAFAEKARTLGIVDWILDPGFGFAKTEEQNWELLENLGAFRHFGRPILAGVADKRFTRRLGTAYAERLAGERGADILRIH